MFVVYTILEIVFSIPLCLGKIYNQNYILLGFCPAYESIAIDLVLLALLVGASTFTFIGDKEDKIDNFLS